MNCKKCGEKLSAQEEKEVREMIDEGYGNPDPQFCDECVSSLNNTEQEEDFHSDADMGL